MSTQPPEEDALPKRPPLSQRIEGYVAAMFLVAAASLVAGNTAGSPPVGVSSPTPTPVAETPLPTVEPSPSIAVPSTLIEFAVTADAYVFAGRSDLNYGSQTELRVDADPETLTYLQFTVTGIQQPIIGMSLRLTTLGRQTQGFDVRTATAGWVESKITYATRPATDAQILGSSGLIAGAAAIEITLTPAITGNGVYSFALVTNSTTGIALASREAGTSTAPTLLVEVATGT